MEDGLKNQKIGGTWKDRNRVQKTCIKQKNNC